jgi:peptidyl-prolyl cis-trans isomerase C
MFKSPIFHIALFGFLLGIVLIIVFGRSSPVDDSTRVVVTAGDMAQLRAGWSRTWQRDPTVAEMQGMLEKFVRDEVFFREAIRLGYDQGDPMVRNSMKLKMEFLGEAQAENTEPSLEEMQAYYAMRKDRYRVPAEVSFVHVYINTDKRGEQAATDALRVLDTLRAEDPDLRALSGYGDPLMLKTHYADQDEAKLVNSFGDIFAQQVLSLEPGTFQGPVESGYGLHLVKVYDRQEAYLPDIDVVASKIRRDMNLENRQAAKELFYTEILKNYQVEFDDSVRELAAQQGRQ